uniref:Phytocyanin domain-containing protein n=1 Tax=Opuntia streptacantha TaxID=393608 RepID=A0A7C9DY46_OPUST
MVLIGVFLLLLPCTLLGLLRKSSDLAMFSGFAQPQLTPLAGLFVPTPPFTPTGWASQEFIQVGDVLEFNFVSGEHTVAAAYDGCNITNLLSPAMTTSPARITLNATGTHYFLCTLPGHCSLGLKLSVFVNRHTRSLPSHQLKTSPPPPPRGLACSAWRQWLLLLLSCFRVIVFPYLTSYIEFIFYFSWGVFCFDD